MTGDGGEAGCESTVPARVDVWAAAPGVTGLGAGRQVSAADYCINATLAYRQLVYLGPVACHVLLVGTVTYLPLPPT